MNGTWISSVPAGRVRSARLVFLACVVSGLIQKPLLKFAWDVQSLQTQLKRVHECMRTRCGGAALLGGTAILLRQIFATKGQEKVGDVAVSLAVAGKMWDKQAITRLHSELRKMDPRDTMKRKGFMTLWSGPKWVSGLAKAKNMKQFLQASHLVGEFLTSKVLEPSSFHELCVALNSPHAKLHNVATYSIPHVVRACCVARAFIHGDGAEKPIQLDATAWEKHLRDMHDQTTSKMFGLLGVASHRDAQILQSTLVELARHIWSASVARHFASMSIVDLPCQACEFSGVLGAVKSIHGGGDVQTMNWLLSHLPGDLGELKTMGETLRRKVAFTEGKGDGLDRQSAGVVTRVWLKQKPCLSIVSMKSVLTNGSWDMFGLLVVVCPKCSQPMPGRWRGRKPTECDACYRKRIRQADAERKAKQRCIK